MYPDNPGPDFETILTDLIQYVERDKHIVLEQEYIGPIIEDADNADLIKITIELNRTIRSLEQNKLSAKTIPLQTFRDWVTEVESFSFNWQSK